MSVTLIAALDRRRGIGRDNQLPWHLPLDLMRFKALTLGKPVLMGRKTAASIGRALPGRPNWVLTRSGQAPFPGQIAIARFEDALGEPDLQVIGGGEVYCLALPHANTLKLTHVDCEIAQADVFFPAFDQLGFSACFSEAHDADARHAYAFTFTDYVRTV